jgi:hypothetical protein
MLASAGWFSAMTLQNAAYVKAVGQIELVFAFLASRLLRMQHVQITSGFVLDSSESISTLVDNGVT